MTAPTLPRYPPLPETYPQRGGARNPARRRLALSWVGGQRPENIDETIELFLGMIVDEDRASPPATARNPNARTQGSHKIVFQSHKFRGESALRALSRPRRGLSRRRAARTLFQLADGPSLGRRGLREIHLRLFACHGEKGSRVARADAASLEKTLDLNWQIVEA